MMVRIGRFLFRYRNAIFPLVYVLLFVNGPPLVANYRLAALVGFCVALGGQIVRAVTVGLQYIVRGGKNRQVYARHLVQGGIFAHCRNPLYVGNFLILLGLGIAADSLLFLALAIPFFLFAYRAIVATEEDYLQTRFGAEFSDYCAHVNRFVPRLSGLRDTMRGMRFNWRRLITAEYGSAFVWLVAVILVALKNLWIHGDYPTSRWLVTTLWCALGLTVVAFSIARFLKKSGRLTGDAVASGS
jgi:protein-S-isoprenylcysteine O-methyltransferase Ste14